MKALLSIFLMLAPLARPFDTADEAAIRKVLVTFNDRHQRATVLTPDADLAPLGRFAGQEVSQVYFETKVIRFVTPEVAFVDATASQFGSIVMKRTMPAYFVVRRAGGQWWVVVLRVQ